MRQKETKRSPLDALAGKGKAVPGAPDLSYSLGGVAEVGGAEVERVLDSVEMDDQVAAMRGPYAGARRIAICRGVRVLAAAAVEVHETTASLPSVIEIPILASARSERRKGFGSVLHALITELAASVGVQAILVCATPEARSFWLRQGYHTLAHCPPALATELRAVIKSGVMSDPFRETVRMAQALPRAGEPGALVASTLRAVASRSASSQSSHGLSSAEAARALGYEDLSGSAAALFQVEGRKRVRVPCDARAPPAALAVQVPLRKLQAFQLDAHEGAAGEGLGAEGSGAAGQEGRGKGEAEPEAAPEAAEAAEARAAAEAAAAMNAPMATEAQGAAPAAAEAAAAGAAEKAPRAAVAAPSEGGARAGGWGEPGWGVRCLSAIQKGEVVLEASAD